MLLRRSLTFLILGGVALVTAELAARMDDWIRMGTPIAHTPDYDHDLLYQDWFGLRGRPNGKFKHWHLNGFGFRSPDMAQRPSPACTRVMILGASETFGYYEAPGKEYPAQLRDSLSARGCYEVVNASLAGLALPGITRLWSHHAAQFQPDVVLIYPTPSFYLNAKPPSVKKDSLAPGLLPGPGPRPRLLDHAKDLVVVPDFIQRRRLERWIAEEVGDKPADWFYRDTPQDRLDLFMADLDSLTRLVKASGATPVLMTHAMRFGPDTRPDDVVLQGWRRFSPRALPGAMLSFQHAVAERMRQYAAQNGLQLVDVAQTMTGRSEYFADFTHFTTEGASLVSGAIAQQLDWGQLAQQKASASAHRTSLALAGGPVVAAKTAGVAR